MGGKLWHRVPDETGKAQLKEVDPSTVSISAPTLVYLSGFLTNNNRPDYVAGSIKRIEDLIKTNKPDAQLPKIYAWSHKGLSNLFNLAIYDSFPSRRSSEAGYTLATSILMPLVADEFKRIPDGTVLGRPKAPEEAAQALRNVTFFGYSAGSIVAQETFNATLKMMKGIGYEEKDARKLLKEVVLVAAGTISRPSKETDRFTTVSMVASNDRINRFKNWAWGAIGTARRTFFGRYTIDKNKKELSVRPLSLSTVFINAAVRPTLYEFKVDAEGNRVKKNIDPLYPAWAQRRSYHELPHYVTTDDKNNGFSRIAFYAVQNALSRTGSAETLKLLDPPANDVFSEEAKEAYRQRISQALKDTPKSLAR